MCSNAKASDDFDNFGTNTHTARQNFYLNEWRDEIFDTDEYAHIFYRSSHYFQVRPYDTAFFRREFSEASESLFRNILVLIPCTECLADTAAGLDDSDGNCGNEIEL